MPALRTISNRMKFLSIGTLLLFAMSFTEGAESSRPRNEYEVKAVFLFHFLQFVEWPKEVMERTEGEYRIGIVGNDPFEGVLDRVIEGEKLNNRTIKILRFPNSDPTVYCHIFFVPRSEAARMETLRRRFGKNPALIVSDIPGFADKGGMVELVKKENKIQLKVNLHEVKESNINVSSRLLRLAEVVGQTKPQ